MGFQAEPYPVHERKLVRARTLEQPACLRYASVTLFDGNPVHWLHNCCRRCCNMDAFLCSLWLRHVHDDDHGCCWWSHYVDYNAARASNCEDLWRLERSLGHGDSWWNRFHAGACYDPYISRMDDLLGLAFGRA